MRLALAAWLALASSGCVGWRTESVSPRELLRGGQVQAIRITKTDKTMVEMWSPVVSGDSVAGHPTERAIARFAVPLSAVGMIESRHTSVGKTFLAVIAAGAGIAVYALLQSLNQSY